MPTNRAINRPLARAINRPVAGGLLPPAGITFLLKATFKVGDQSFTDAQVLGVPEGVEIGALTVVEPNGTVAIVSNQLSVNGTVGTHGAFNPASVTRQIGLTALADFSVAANSNDQLGYHTAAALTLGNLAAGTQLFDGASLQVRHHADPNVADVVAPRSGAGSFKLNVVTGGYNTSGVPYTSGDVKADFSFGSSLFDDSAGKLLYRMPTNNTTNLFWQVAVANVSVTLLLNSIQIPDPTNPLGDFTTNVEPTVLDTSVAASDTYTFDADFFFEIDVTTVPTAGAIEIRFRIQDASNYWRLTIDGTSTDVDEVVAGVPTQRMTIAASASGDRITLTADNEDLAMWRNDGTRDSFGAAANFKTETAAETNSLGTGGVVAFLGSWSRAGYVFTL